MIIGFEKIFIRFFASKHCFWFFWFSILVVRYEKFDKNCYHWTRCMHFLEFFSKDCYWFTKRCFGTARTNLRARGLFCFIYDVCKSKNCNRNDNLIIFIFEPYVLWQWWFWNLIDKTIDQTQCFYLLRMRDMTKSSIDGD